MRKGPTTHNVARPEVQPLWALAEAARHAASSRARVMDVELAIVLERLRVGRNLRGRGKAVASQAGPAGRVRVGGGAGWG